MPYDLTPQPFPFNPTKPSLPHPRFRDLTGKRFGRLVGVHYCGSQSAGSRPRPIWLCRCDCGESVAVESSNLQSGHTSSCGCLHREFAGENLRTHGLTGIPEHRIWKAMIERCENPNSRAYQWYGAKGVRVCERWRTDFSAFVSDMGRRPSRLLSIDRIDPFGNYEPGNCRWATAKQQANNKRSHALRRQAAGREGASA